MAAPNVVTSDLSISGLYPAIAAGIVTQVKEFPVVLAGLTGTNKVVNDYLFPCNGRVLRTRYVGTVPATTASKAATITPSIGGVNLTGGVLALTTATVGAGAVVHGTAITAGNTFTPTSLFDLTLSAVTAFTEGSGVIEVYYINEDLEHYLSQCGVLLS